MRKTARALVCSLALATSAIVVSSCTRVDQITVQCVTDDDCQRGSCRDGICRIDEPNDDIGAIDDDAAGSGDAAAGVADAGDLGRLGDPCAEDAECESSICVPTPTVGYCTVTCNGECPDPAYRCGADARGNAVCLVTTTDACPGGAFCDPGAVQRDESLCGDCNEGRRTRTRVCTDECRNGDWGGWSPCATEATCAPGETESIDEVCTGCGGGTRSQTRSCNGATCVWDEWSDFGPCEGGDAGALCSAGEVQVENEACGGCGTGTRERTRTCDAASCDWGAWSEWTACAMPPDRCTPGEPGREETSCGGCGGTQSRTRACLAGCTWAPWSDWSTCSAGAAVCSPGAVERRSQGCGNCGTQEQTRTCAADGCSWGEWSGWGACNGSGPCSPGAHDQSDCGGCSERVCNSSCQWSACQLDAGAACEWNAGRNWRCCGGGRWQYCLSTCQWSTDCAACTGCGC
jgi:hypothetical protein